MPADIADDAQAAEALHLRAAFSHRPASHPSGQAECEDCGEAIPEARRRAVPDAVRCVFCQAQVESRSEGR
ncbi:TraR/DksA C4-type zinc finger protein [Niveispirillum sp. KHB5.9]|uniref:TraR/DksA C4-type zinc finger protein n=1 Tax=Niveispirillum sp. KHB5.9 TaxID=3400269 RepID=UPI003A871AAC